MGFVSVTTPPAAEVLHWHTGNFRLVVSAQSCTEHLEVWNDGHVSASKWKGRNAVSMLANVSTATVQCTASYCGTFESGIDVVARVWFVSDKSLPLMSLAHVTPDLHQTRLWPALPRFSGPALHTGQF